MKGRSPVQPGAGGRVALAAACALMAASCVHRSGTNVDLGLKRVALNLAFKDASKARLPTLQQVAQTPQLAPQVADALAGLQGSGLTPTEGVGTLRPAPGPDLLFNCPKAPAGARPEALSPGTITTPPTTGTYLQHNQGTFKLMYGALNLAGAYQPQSAMDITNVRVTPSSGGTLFQSANPPTIDFDAVDRNLVQTVTTSYHVTSTQLQLTKIVTKVNQSVTTFQPVPPVEIYGFNAPNGWTSGGIDPNTGTAMAVQGAVAGEELVDVCGQVYDAYKVVSSERIINPQTGYSYQTDQSDPKVYWFANQFGGLMLKEHENSHTVETVTVNGTPVPVTVDINNTAVLNSVTAQRLGTNPSFE